ncbi:hypothetical protein Plhal703r1_c22g0095501 [Plasmopara halstedii]
MKSAAAFSTYLALCLFVTDDVRAAPFLRGLQLTNDAQTTKIDENNKGLHHLRQVKTSTKKTKKIVNSVSGKALQHLRVAVTAPSISFDTVSSSDDVVTAPSALVDLNAQNSSISDYVLSTSATVKRREMNICALVTTVPSFLTNSTKQTPETQDSNPEMIEVPLSPFLSQSFEGDRRIGADPEISTNNDFLVSNDIPKNHLNGAHRIYTPNDDFLGRHSASIDGSYNQRINVLAHSGKALNNWNRQNMKEKFGRNGGNLFLGAMEGRMHPDFRNFGFDGSNIFFGNIYEARRK